MERFLAIVNPAAGGGRSAKLAGPALAKLREAGLHIDVIASTAAGHATQLAKEAFDQGYRQFIAVGGDGTAHEIVNGVFSAGAAQRRISLGFLPLGTGNSFLRDFTKAGAEDSLKAIVEGRKRSVDLVKLTHGDGITYSLNLLSIGFTADVGALTNRPFATRCDDDKDWDERRSLFLTFNNSKFTGGTMMIAPNADPTDGYIEFVRWGPIGRLGLIRMLPKLYDGTHIQHPLASRRSVRHVDFNIPTPVDVMIDGEIVSLTCKSLDILPAALDVYV
jgi:diacylglycerol kinase (ATP)